MMTEWGEKVTPENAWRSYPRPQMVRKNWVCLNGLWEYAITTGAQQTVSMPWGKANRQPVKFRGDILVPFAVETPLSGVGQILEPTDLLWYRRTIDVQPKPGERILDACTAPGGKTVQISWRGACVTACEVNPKRRRRLEENLARLGLSDKVSVIGELTTSQSFDKVLVDAPCSNTGVLRRRPDARWNWSEEKTAALVKLQSEILDLCAPLVSPGGTLVYSTCSNEPEENEQQVAAFLARHVDFSLEESRESVPFDSGTDGAFAARLVRKSS